MHPNLRNLNGPVFQRVSTHHFLKIRTVLGTSNLETQITSHFGKFSSMFANQMLLGTQLQHTLHTSGFAPEQVVTVAQRLYNEAC